MDRVVVVDRTGGVRDELALYTPRLAAPVGWPSDGVWLTGHPRMPEPEAETGSGWRVVVGALLVGGLWGVAVAWTLLALVRAM